MDRMLLPIFGTIFLLLCGVGATSFYYTHDPIGFHVQILWWHPGFDLPNSLATRYDLAERRASKAEAALKPWQDAYYGVRRDVQMCEDGQRAVVEASAAQIAASGANAKAARGALERALANRSKIVASLPMASGDACQRAKAVDAAFLASLHDEKDQ